MHLILQPERCRTTCGAYLEQKGRHVVCSYNLCVLQLQKALLRFFLVYLPVNLINPSLSVLVVILLVQCNCKIGW